MGVAHGLVGIVYMLLQAMMLSEKLAKTQRLFIAVYYAVKKILDLVTENKGILPKKCGEINYNIQFCCGTPGVIPLLLLAAQEYPRLKPDLIE